MTVEEDRCLLACTNKQTQTSTSAVMVLVRAMAIDFEGWLPPLSEWFKRMYIELCMYKGGVACTVISPTILLAYQTECYVV